MLSRVESVFATHWLFAASGVFEAKVTFICTAVLGKPARVPATENARGVAGLGLPWARKLAG